MRTPAKPVQLVIGFFLIGALQGGCGQVAQDQPAQQVQAKSPPQQQTEKQVASPEKAKAKTKTKVAEVEGVISSVGQRTITFQLERKGKIREEVVGIDEKTDIEKSGSKVKLRDLQVTDKALIKYEPDAYTPAHSVKVTGQGKVKKVGGDD